MFVSIGNGLFVELNCVLALEHKKKIEQFISLRKDWYPYPLQAWEEKFGSRAIALVYSEDRSEGYEKNCAEIFLLANEKFALVTESGCSCYEAERDAEIELFPTITEAKQQMKKFFKRWE